MKKISVVLLAIIMSFSIMIPDAAFAIGFLDDTTIYISARSNKKVNVNKIMSELKGGGNPQCAGARIYADDLFQVENKLMDAVPAGLSDKENIIEEPPVIKKKQIKRK